MTGDRIIWVRGETRPGPTQTIGVLEIREDGGSRVAFAERTEIDGRCHIMLARKAFGSKTSLATRWWSLVIDQGSKISTVRNGSCGDSLTTADVPRIIAALEDLDLYTDQTFLVVDDGPSVLPWWKRSPKE